MSMLARSLADALMMASLLLGGASLQADDQADQYDVLFFASEGPVFLRVTLKSSGVGTATVRERYVSVLFDALDADEDGRLSETESRQLPDAGRFTAESKPLGDRWTELDTSPADGSISRDELAAFLGPLLGERFATRRKAPLLVQSVQLHSRLDSDGDRQISRAEIEQGIETLRQYDFDGDETLSPAELQPFPQSMLDATMSAATGGDNRDFVVLSEEEPLGPLAERLIATYAEPGAGGLALSHIQVSELAFASLDENQDGTLQAAELVALLQRPRPHAEVYVDFRRRRVTLKPMSFGTSRVSETSSASDRQLTARLGGEIVEFSAKDNRYQAGDQISLLKIEFRRQDGDKNGYLNPQEFAMLGNIGANFDAVDLDEDGQVFLSELDRFIQLDAYFSQSFAEMTVDAIDKPLFQILDENSDRRLTQKEFAAGTERMQPYDRDGDGRLDEVELLALRKYRVAFSFGVPPAVRIERQNQMDPDRRLPVVRPTTAGPEWFRKMDRNQDGDVTWREFLGPRASFDKLDSDGSGWVDADEAEAFPSE